MESKPEGQTRIQISRIEYIGKIVAYGLGGGLIYGIGNVFGGLMYWVGLVGMISGMAMVVSTIIQFIYSK